MSVRLRPAARTIASAVVLEPTKPIPSTPGWVTRAAPTAPSPWTTLIAPGGNPASSIASASAAPESGVYSLGLSTTALPPPRAAAASSAGMFIGKLNGVSSA